MIKQALLILILIAFSLLGGALGGELNNYLKFTNNQEVGIEGLNTTTVESIRDECVEEGRIDKQLECINTHVDRFFYYTVRPDNQTISFNTLMNEGGDCGNWAKFWEYFASEYGYEITVIRIPVNDTVAHRFSIFSNDEGYCRVDQTTIDCYIYG